ncbi:poly(A)-specific ribonuclease [Aureococcus anophagefferens]|nr:poly(A)-specific ribonuclease [Aureococcus anophagefferens]
MPRGGLAPRPGLMQPPYAPQLVPAPPSPYGAAPPFFPGAAAPPPPAVVNPYADVGKAWSDLAAYQDDQATLCPGRSNCGATVCAFDDGKELVWIGRGRRLRTYCACVAHPDDAAVKALAPLDRAVATASAKWLSCAGPRYELLVKAWDLRLGHGRQPLLCSRLDGAPCALALARRSVVDTEELVLAGSKRPSLVACDGRGDASDARHLGLAFPEHGRAPLTALAASPSGELLCVPKPIPNRDTISEKWFGEGGVLDRAGKLHPPQIMAEDEELSSRTSPWNAAAFARRSSSGGDNYTRRVSKEITESKELRKDGALVGVPNKWGFKPNGLLYDDEAAKVCFDVVDPRVVRSKKELQAQERLAAAAERGADVPHKYAKHVIDVSRRGVDGFDFSRYNRTPFGGLENALGDARFTNAALLLLYFLPELRQLVLADQYEPTAKNVLPSAPPAANFVLELSFLFQKAGAAAEAPAGERKRRPLARKALVFHRFALEQLAAHLADGARVQRLLGFTSATENAGARPDLPELLAFHCVADADDATTDGAWASDGGPWVAAAFDLEVDGAGRCRVFEGAAGCGDAELDAATVDAATYELVGVLSHVDRGGDALQTDADATVGEMEALEGVVAHARAAASYFTRAAEEQAKPASFAAKLAIERDRQSSPSRRDRPKSNSASKASRRRPRQKEKKAPAVEFPAAGGIVALDSEYVSVESADTSVRRDGSRVTTSLGRMSLARLSVVDGDERVLFDDYVLQTETVVDYNTRFSGVAAEDLDPATSKHDLYRRAVVCMKLRRLVDAGCVLVGHSLQSDFRVMNVAVPPDQVIDTAQLFSRPGERKISLRFLCSYLLDHVIQDDNHDSVEDARAALRLYRLYQKLKAEGTLRETLGRVYDHGRKTEWTIVAPKAELSGRRGVRRGRRRRDAPPDVAGLTVSAPPDEPQPPGTAAPPS